MNRKQKAILGGRKPKHCADDEPTLDDAAKMIQLCGPSPLAACFEHMLTIELIRDAILRSFCVPAKWLESTGEVQFSSWSIVGTPSDPSKLSK